MITSNSTFEEIDKMKNIDEPLIQNFIINKVTRERNKLLKIFKVRKYYTPSQPATFHSHVTGIHWRIFEILMHNKKPSSIERAKGLNFIVESENRIKYTIINDLETGQPILVLPYPNNTFFVSTHAIRRYRERFLGEEYTFDEACDAFIRRSPYYVCSTSRSTYGCSGYSTILYRIADGLLLGFYDKDREVAKLETFISLEMLNDEQKDLSGFKHNDKLLKDQRDMVLGLTPFDEKLSESMTSSAVYAEQDDGFKELTEEEIDELVRMSQEELEAIPEEERKRQLLEEQEANRKRFDNKMYRKGYK